MILQPKSQIQLAGAIITNPDGAILLLHRNTPKRTQWEIPGGKIEPGESAEHAAIRELREELNIDIHLIRELGAKEFTEDQSSLHYTWFLAQVTSDTPSIGEPQTFDQLRYFTRADLEAIRPELSPVAALALL